MPPGPRVLVAGLIGSALLGVVVALVMRRRRSAPDWQHGMAAVTINDALDVVERSWARAADEGLVAQDWTDAVVHFHRAPAGQGTEVIVEFDYQPAPAPVALLERLASSDLEHRMKEELRRFKQIVETGEIARTNGVDGRL